MSTAEAWTNGKLLTWTADYLKKHGSTSPRLDAEVLLAHAQGCQRIGLYTAFEQEPSDEIRTAFREMVRRRAEGTPVAYLVGHKEFYSLSFEVNPDVLIPRPESELLVVEALDLAKSLNPQNGRVLEIVDIGTGSGCIAIAIAKHCPGCRVTAVDISPEAIGLARRNVQRHGIDDRQLKLVQGDMLNWCQADEQFDLIVSNPPYVSQDEYQQLARTVRDFEPRTALVAEPTPADLLSKLITQAGQRLRSGGYLVFELSPMLAPQVQQMVTQPALWEPHRIRKDLAGLARVVILKKL
ncbi:MAG: peptide chain release factor N(5)-glutamine methyltransferase [Pirellulaceae bacterium]|nr:peptide chain release factor N(5)-glutamine methyltransferase [Pirellulaceae bacterium]